MGVLPTASSEIQKVWASVRFAELMSYLNITFRLSINQAVLAIPRLWYFFIEFLCAKLLSVRRTSSLCSILEMRPGRKRLSPRSRKRCLMAKRMSRELCIIKACLTFLKSFELSWLEVIIRRALAIKKTRGLVAKKEH